MWFEIDHGEQLDLISNEVFSSDKYSHNKKKRI